MTKRNDTMCDQCKKTITATASMFSVMEGVGVNSKYDFCNKECLKRWASGSSSAGSFGGL